MTHLRASLAIVAVAFVAAACSGSSASPSPTTAPTPPAASAPIVGTVDTPEEALAAVIAAEPRLTGIQPLMPDLIGQSAWYKVTPASGVGAYIVEITVGWGDCQAGCIDRHTWTYVVQPDGSVAVQSESGGSVPPDAWPRPTG